MWHNGLSPPTLTWLDNYTTPESVSSVAAVIRQSLSILNGHGASTFPCSTPVVTWNGPEMFPSTMTVLLDFL